MKRKVAGWLALTVLSFTAAGQAAYEPSDRLEIFGAADYYFRGDIDDPVIADYDAAVDTLGNAGYDITTSGGIGGRLGVRKPFSNELFDLGVSVGLVAGPTIEVDFDSLLPPGTSKEKITTRFERLMAEAGVRLRVSERAFFRLGGAAGIGRSTQEDKYTGTGFYSGDRTFKTTDTGLAWELTPSFIFAAERVKFELGVRYAVFPKIKETDDTRELDWKTFGFFAGLAF